MSDKNKNTSNIQIKADNLNLSKKTLESILESIRVAKNRLSSIENVIMEAQRSQHSATRDIPGELGYFDGEYLVSESGIKYEVPKNYSAKSLLIVGDELKKYQEDGEDRFKIVNKIPRKKVKGILSKKDGKFFALMDNNKSYVLSKHAVEFRNLKQGDEIIVVIPEKDNGSDYAAVDKLAKKENQEVAKKEVNTIAEKKVSPILEEQPTELPKNETPGSKKIEFTDEDLL